MAIFKALFAAYWMELVCTILGFFLAYFFDNQVFIFVFWGIAGASLITKFIIGTINEIKEFRKTYEIKHGDSDKN